MIKERKKGGRQATQAYIELQMEVEHCLRYAVKEKNPDFIPALVKLRKAYIAKERLISTSTHCIHWKKAITDSLTNMGENPALAEEIRRASSKSAWHKI
jgi:hypothetical protein